MRKGNIEVKSRLNIIRYFNKHYAREPSAQQASKVKLLGEVRWKEVGVLDALVPYKQKERINSHEQRKSPRVNCPADACTKGQCLHEQDRIVEACQFKSIEPVLNCSLVLFLELVALILLISLTE